MENILEILRDCFAEQAEEHRIAASNERLWAKGAPDQETAEMHEDNAMFNMQLADIYENMAKDVLNIVEKYSF